MSDPVANWLLSLGATTKDTHGINERMKFICQHFGLPKPNVAKSIHKKMFNKIRESLIKGDEITKERFITLTLLSIQPKGKWDCNHIAFCRSRNFYSSAKWKNLRLKALAQSNKCMACGKSPKYSDVILHVDHILPRSIYPEYALDINNLQILCDECNIGKGNTIIKNFK